MAPKNKSKKGKKKKIMGLGNELPSVVMERIKKTYLKNCKLTETAPSNNVVEAVAAAIEEQVLLDNFILEPVLGAIVSLDSFLATMRQVRYVLIKALYVWEVPLDYKEIANMALFLEKGCYELKHLDFMDCLIEASSIKRLALSFNVCTSLTKVELDYNDFGDEGCAALCAGLTSNITLLSLSMCYCGLTIPSGAVLGKMITTSAVRDLYIDGNDLECEGTIDLLKKVAVHAEMEHVERLEEERLKREEEELEKSKPQESDDDGRRAKTPTDDKDKKAKGKKKKKKGKKKKNKEPPPPPAIGPWIHKLHVADNGIDAMGKDGRLAAIICMRVVRQLVSYSLCLQELDLEDNLVGDLGGRELMEALEDRQHAELPGIKMRTTHKMDTNTLNTIIKLGAGLKKKKKKGKGKKKKKKK